jgi:signal peptidase I
MTSTTEPQTMRRIRPWIAALLTLFGLGLGLYYARRARLAWWAVAASIVIGVALGAGILAYIIITDSVPAWFVPTQGWSIFDTINIVVTAFFAIFVWAVAARRQQVERAGPGRLWGYLAIWLLPLLLALLLAMSLRFAVMQPFRIPSGSMQPTLQVGDYILVKKWSYGYSRFSAAPLEDFLPEGRIFSREPERGDLAVYRPSPEPDRDFVSRVVGLPGDSIQMIDGVLHINGSAVTREDLGMTAFSDDEGNEESIHAWRETLPNDVSYTTFDRLPQGELDNTPVFQVPEGHYFMMGDDRDNAADSRVPYVVGYVPFDHFVGRVEHVIASAPGRATDAER